MVRPDRRSSARFGLGAVTAALLVAADVFASAGSSDASIRRLPSSARCADIDASAAPMNYASRHLHGLQTVLFLLIFSLVYWSPPASNRVYAVVTMLLCIVGATLSSAGARRVAAAARAGRDDVRS